MISIVECHTYFRYSTLPSDSEIGPVKLFERVRIPSLDEFEIKPRRVMDSSKCFIVVYIQSICFIEVLLVICMSWWSQSSKQSVTSHFSSYRTFVQFLDFRQLKHATKGMDRYSN